MDGTSTFGRIGTAAGILLLGACALLGGCNKQNKQLELAQQEAAELREKNVELDTRLRERDTRIAELEGRLSQVSASPSGDRGYTPPREPWSDRRTTSGGYQTETFTVSGDVLFDSGQATLKATAKKELDRVAAQIRSKHPNASVTVNGYTDSDPIRKSKWGSNEALSQARADAVARYLQSKGMGDVTAVGMGSANPKATKAASRRVEIVVAH